MRARSDWYQATIRVSGALVRDALLSEYVGARQDPVQPRLGYGSGYAVVDAQGRRAIVMEGGRNQWPNVQGSGQDAPGIQALLRAVFPEHEVTRYDSAIDFDGEGAWSQAVAIGEAVADRHRVAWDQRGDWRPGRGEKGRTFYLGSAKSAVRVRVYEKGKERAQRGDDSVPASVVRAEVEVRPKDRARVGASTMAPEEVWGFSKFSADYYRRLTGLEVHEHHVRDYRASSDIRALQAMAEQYQPTLDRLSDRMGGWEQLMGRLQLEVGAARARKRRASSLG